MKPVRLPVNAYRELAKTVRAQILKTNSPDSCIPSTKAMVEALRQLHVDVFALPVTAMAVNAPLWAYAHEHGGYPAIGTPEYPEDGFGIGIGYIGDETQPGKWNGHLVCVAERRWLLDLSIDQASRPQWNMPITEPLVAPVDEVWLRARTNLPLVIEHETAHIYYWPNPGNEGYKESPGWSGEKAPTVSLKMPRRVRSYPLSR